jgi:tryptophan-rich sensory protein
MEAMMTASRQIGGLLGWLLLAFAAAALGAVASVSAASFYRELDLPGWAPPGSVFGPVWTVLYAMMGVAAWLVWREAGFRNAGGALALFVVQLAVNALWSWLFFAWRMGLAAFVDIVTLWVLLVMTIVAFWRVQRWAGALLLPYLAWVSFAAVLCYAIWQRNPGALGG